MRKTLLVTAIICIILSILILTGGRLTLSWYKESNLEAKVQEKYNEIALPSISTDTNRNVIVKLFNDVDHSDIYYIATFHRHSLVDVYTIDEVHKVNRLETPVYYSVVSSSNHNHAFEVNLETETVVIQEGNISYFSYQTGFLVILLSIGVVYLLLDKRES